MAPRKVIVPDSAHGKRLDAVLRDTLPGVSLEHARRLISAGSVRIRGKIAKLQRKCWGGEELEIDAPAPRAVERREGVAIPVLFETGAFLVVNKPPGIVVEPDGHSPSLVELVGSQQRGFDVEGEARPGVVHRLDRETSGCVLLARTDDAVGRLKQAFEEKRIDKRYLAVVLGAPPERQSLDTPYARDPDNARLYTTRMPSPRRARLSFQVRERFADAALVEIALETGRTHQIRAQLSDLGFPVVGDPLYGGKATRTHPAAAAIGRLALHAWRLAITGAGDDASSVIAVEAPVPEDFERGLRLLRSPPAV